MVLAMRLLFITYNVTEYNGQKMDCNDQKCFVTVTKCDVTLLSIINRYKSFYDFLDIF